MKKLLNLLYIISTSMGQARAASALARAGMYAEAKALMTK
jgi:hypothetical protein